MHSITTFVDQYGYGVLFISLLLEMLALPLPGEFIMSYAGLLVFEGKLNLFMSIVSAAAGTCIGMTLSFLIGSKLGSRFFEKYGARFHFGPDKLKKTAVWFDKYGNKMLIIAPFIPGVRHITGYFSGITRMPMRTYMIYAYTGAIIWTSAFITLGKVLGPKWEQFHSLVSRYLVIAGLWALVIFIIIYVYNKWKSQIMEWVLLTLHRSYQTYHSLGRIRVFVAAAGVAFIVLFGLLIGLIQDFFGQELSEFDVVVTYMVETVLEDRWSSSMQLFGMFASFPVLCTAAAITILLIIRRGKERLLEIGFLLFVYVGGEALEEGLRRLFHRLGPHPSGLPNAYTFPSEQTLITLTVFGFCAYLLFRHYGTLWVRIVAPICVIVIVVLVGLSRIYFEVQYPSDVVAGIVVSGVWLSLNIVLLELFRIMAKEKSSAY